MKLLGLSTMALLQGQTMERELLV
ncbi:hypothetical protein Gorai_003452 [Gossypium raimondii]|uniref:Uncharacterized protein n=1 Tax=Gossypium raimondii TaxID=29730 RepID=A0A7J8QQ82_GOSRA|nr:hypothetical protein [Gossypium raimondii]